MLVVEQGYQVAVHLWGKKHLDAVSDSLQVTVVCIEFGTHLTNLIM